MEHNSEWIKLLIGSGISSSAFLVIVIIYLFMNPAKFEHWMAIFWRVLYVLTSIFPKVKQKVDRRAVASSIQDSVNGICEQVDKESPGILPHPIRIEWVRSESPESFIKSGKAVVHLKHYANQDRNIVDSTLWYLKVGLLPRTKHCLDKTLRKCCEFKIAIKVFMARRDTGAYDYFMDNELAPAITTEPNLEQDLQMLEHLDYTGLFTHVFLTEIKQTGQKLLGTIATPVIQQELRNLALFLHTIADKGYKRSSERVPLTFNGIKVKVAVILVASKETIELHGIAPHINRVEQCVRQGYESIYISGWGKEFTKKVLEIRKEVEGKSVTILNRYNIPIVKGILLTCQSNLSYLAQQKKLQEEVRQALNEIVPEIKDGKIEIVSIARVRSIGCKIAVRMESGGSVYEARSACIGENAERHAALKVRFPNEFIAIVCWSDDIKEFIVNALTPLNPRYVETVEIDEENLVAHVKVSTDDAYKKALGKNGNNVNIASELTEWAIIMEGETLTTTVPIPNEELRQILIEHIPEVKNNEIEVVKIARIKGVGSRVIVRWKEDGDSKRVMASQVCRGYNNEYLDTIRQKILGEYLYFHEWYDEPTEQIINCLYPLKSSDVDSINLDAESKTAIVILRDINQSSLLWRGPYNLVLSERVTDWTIEIRGL